MSTIDDLIYSPIPQDDEPAGKTFHDLCEDARKVAEARRQKIEGEFHHLRGKLFTRDNADGSVDVVHRELAKMRRARRRSQFGRRH